MEGTPKAIEIQGITRNATKIGVKDGQAEDLINLRFVDGSWRASGDGRLIDFTMNRTYSQIYVHTNVYHHLLGVYEDPTTHVRTLYWFADIANDGVTFTPLDTPVKLTTVVGDIWITQAGHLLTIIDQSDNFEFFIFKTGENQYVEVNVDVNGKEDKETKRTIYPFGQVHFNLYSPSDADSYKHIKRHSGDGIAWDTITIAIAHADMLEMFKKATEKNQFTRPFLAVVACKLYDDSYVFASQPVLLFPRELPGLRKHYYLESGILDEDGNYSTGAFVREDINLENQNRQRISFVYEYSGFPHLANESAVVDLNGYDALNRATKRMPAFFTINYAPDNPDVEKKSVIPIPVESLPVYSSGMIKNDDEYNDDTYVTCVMGSDLVLSLQNYDFIDGDTIKGLGVFITNQVDIFNMAADGYKDSDQSYEHTEATHLKNTSRIRSSTYQIQNGSGTQTKETEIISYIPGINSEEKITYDLLHSNFHLLKFYDKQTIAELRDNPKINLSVVEDDGVLSNINEQKMLTTEAFSRTTYLPKVSYEYNNRLHIANYKSYPFFGYPIDLFHLHNHSVKVQADSWFKGVLPNLAANNDEYLQYTKDYWDFTQESAIVNNREALIAAGAPYFLIKVHIDTSNGEQIVSRYIPAYNPSIAPEHTANFIEALNPLLTYPDSRATKMEIYYFYNKTTDVSSNTLWVFNYSLFNLKPHPYLNLAYYIKPDLKPISIWYDLIGSTEVFTNPTADDMAEFVKMQNTEEYFPNGLKVSKADNPMFFPVENAYRVGSSEILALISNTIPVGTGQTGDAPLYIFCKDGVYAAFVDASGEMVYPNTRPLAPDVCNNPRSVTKTDLGVVFTTDRGLMRMNGNQVDEIGQPAEGDVMKFTNQSSPDFIQVAKEALLKLADLPIRIADTTDFLTYLKGAIINYNHNQRELIVTNPSKKYSYVLDREGNWSRRTYTADEYVNNYPTSYRLSGGSFYKMDEEQAVSMEEAKEAPNNIFYLSNVIKLDSIGFKQAYRFVVRGFFDTSNTTRLITKGRAQGTMTETNYIPSLDIFYNNKTKVNKLHAGKTLQEMRDHKFRLYLDNREDSEMDLKIGFAPKQGTNGTDYGGAYFSDAVEPDDNNAFNIMLNDSDIPDLTTNQLTGGELFLYDAAAAAEAQAGQTYSKTYDVDYELTEVLENGHVGIYVFGSDDGRKWARLGGNERSGKFTDIGCLVERTDVRFFRVCLAGQVTGKTRIEYMEMSAGGSVLNGKIR